MRALPLCVLMAVIVQGCASPGYHYETGDFFTQTPNSKPFITHAQTVPPSQVETQRQAFEARAQANYLSNHPGNTSLDFYRYRSFCLQYAEWVTLVSGFYNGHLSRTYAENWAREESAKEAIGLDPQSGLDIENVLLQIVGGIYSGIHMTYQEASDDCLMGHRLHDPAQRK